MRLDLTEWQKWQTWAHRVAEDLRHLRDDYAVFTKFREICKENADWISSVEGDHFCSFIFRSYGTAVSVGIRRHLKTKDSASLARLLDQVASCADQITWSFYQERFPKSGSGYAWLREVFSTLSQGQECVSSDLVCADLLKFRDLNSGIEEYVDKVLAHADKDGSEKIVYFDDIETSLKEFALLARKYVVFLTGHDHDEFRSSIAFPWTRVFHHPFVQPENGKPFPRLRDQ